MIPPSLQGSFKVWCSGSFWNSTLSETFLRFDLLNKKDFSSSAFAFIGVPVYIWLIEGSQRRRMIWIWSAACSFQSPQRPPWSVRVKRNPLESLLLVSKSHRSRRCKMLWMLLTDFCFQGQRLAPKSKHPLCKERQSDQTIPGVGKNRAWRTVVESLTQWIHIPNLRR